MVRKGKKQKYRDVVGKKKEEPTKNKPKNRKTYSLYKNDNKKSFGKKRKFEHDRVESGKKPNLEAPVQRPVQYDPSSESEEELLDDMAQLRQTLGVNTKKLLAIESEDESLSDEQSTVEDEVLVDELDESDSENSGVEDGIEESDSDVNSSADESEADVDDENKIGHDSSFIQEEIGEIDAKEEFELDPEYKEGEVDLERCDPFEKHILFEIHDGLIETLQKIPISHETHIENWSKLGKLIVQIPKSDKIDSVKTVLDKESTLVENKHYAPPGEIPMRNDIKKLDSLNTGIKTQIIGHLAKCNKSLIDKGGPIFTSFQNELFSIINNYQDLFFSERTFDNAEDLKFVYCLHAVNHILKTRTKVLHHNARLSKKTEVPEEFRDQGLVRPKILIIVPFKDAAFKIISTIIEILYPEDKGNVMNKKRFLEEFTGNEISMPKKNPKPEDYELTFTGNTSDEFKVGITLTKKSLKLYADFYSSDIIVASPLGLRMIIGAEGEQERDYDFLASIELLIVDQAELFLMQNWDHLLHIFNHLHLQPKDSHGTDFSRVRLWSLNGWAKYYRQTLIFSSIVLPEINSIFNKRCTNYAGKVRTSNLIDFGTISQVVVQLPHVFHKFEAGDVSSAIDARFDFFVGKILPHQRDALMKQSLIFVANYFDFVRLRNYFKREDIGFTQICEYSKDGKIARARDMFFHGDSHFMLYTERYHFFNRIRIKGIRHLVFYQLPNFPHFYYEMCNLMQETNMNKKVGNMSNMTVTVLYSKYDVHQLAAIAGTERASKMAKSDRNVHMMVTGT